MESSVPDDRLVTTIWAFTAAQHFACFQRELRSLGVSHHRHALHGLGGGGATDHWLQCRDLPQLRRRGRATSERTLERHAQEGTFLLHQIWLSKEVADRLRALAVFAPRSVQNETPKSPHHQLQQQPRCGGEG